MIFFLGKVFQSTQIAQVNLDGDLMSLQTGFMSPALLYAPALC